MIRTSIACTALAGLLLCSGFHTVRAEEDPTALLLQELEGRKVGKHDWPQWGGWTHKNNTPEATGIPTEWNVKSGENVLWSAPLGSQTYGNASFHPAPKRNGLFARRLHYSGRVQMLGT